MHTMTLADSQLKAHRNCILSIHYSRWVCSVLWLILSPSLSSCRKRSNVKSDWCPNCVSRKGGCRYLKKKWTKITPQTHPTHLVFAVWVVLPNFINFHKPLYPFFFYLHLFTLIPLNVFHFLRVVQCDFFFIMSLLLGCHKYKLCTCICWSVYEYIMCHFFCNSVYYIRLVCEMFFLFLTLPSIMSNC